MVNRVDYFIEALISTGDLCKGCIGGDDCHGDYICETLERIIPEAFNELWIPVTERLPETTDHVLVSCKTKKGVKVVNRSYYSGKHWAGVMSDVEAWMPLPEPFRGDD